MATKINPETGEQYEDYSDAYQAEASSLPPLEEPPGSSVDFAGEKYTTPLITGYGGRTAILKPGEEPTNEWGRKVSPEYIKDIEDVFTSDNPEETATRKMAARGIPSRPSDNDLNYFDELTKFRKVAQQQIGIDPDAEYKKGFSERIDSVMRNYNSASRALLTPADRVKIERDAQTFAVQRKEKALAQLNHEMGVADQAFKIGWDKQQKEREAALNILKAPTDDQRLERELTATLGRKPTDAEFNAKKQERAVEIAGAKQGAVENAKGAGGFTTWTPEAQKQAFMTNVLTKETPASVKGLGGNDRKAYAKAYGQWQVDTGFSPQDIALMQADYRAGDVSLKNMAKQEGPMDAFVGNINKQIAKVKQLYDNNDRTGLRMLDLPVRELKTRALGSGEEAVKASYLLEISNEIGKLSSGASASVQQLSDSAKEDWKKVHDVNLSMKDIMTIVNATRDQANMRIESWRDAKQSVRQQLGGIGVTGAKSSPGGGPPASSLREGFNTNFANGQTWTLKNGKPVQVR